MKLTPQTIAFIEKTVETILLAKINNLIIEPGCIRAMEENRSVLVFHDKDVPEMEFPSIGISEANAFMSRFNIAKSVGQVDIDATMDKDNQFVRSLEMRGKGIKIDFRCANPATIRAPKSMKDPVKFKVQMTSDAVTLMTKGVTALSTDEVSIVGSADKVSIVFEDANRDKLEYQFGNKIEYIDSDDTGSFDRTYPVKVLLPLLRDNPDNTLYITQNGLIKLSINGLDMYVPPRV